MVKKKGKSQMTKTKKTGILKGVGAYRKNKRTTNRIRGQGGFFEDVGRAVGPWLGSKADGLFNKVFGSGSYQVTKNTLTAQASDPPILSNTKGATRVQHREYIQDVSGSTAFNLLSFPINPGLAPSFPWLASVANCFEEYILHGIIFEFKSTSATALNSTNTALGTVIMATEYNALHGDFTTKRDMENYVYSTSCSPDMSALHPVECARDVNVLHELYVRNSPPTLPTDLRFSDLGRFQIATVGMQAAAVIGELWVTYDIELLKPRLPDAITSVAPVHYAFDTVLFPSINAVPTSSNFFGAFGLNNATTLGTGVSPVTLNGLDIRYPTPGRYVTALSIVFSANITIPAITLTGTTGATAYNMFVKNGARVSSLISPAAGATTQGQVIICSAVDSLFAGSGAYPTITYSFGAGFGGASILSYDLIVVPLPVGFLADKTICLDDLQSIKYAINYIRKFESDMSNYMISDEQKASMIVVPRNDIDPKPPNSSVPSNRGYW